MKTTKEMNNKKTAKNGLNPTSQKGITLIALIITIIIMLILVGVTISMAVNGGLFDYAGKAVGDMENAIAYENELANGRIKIGGVWYDSIDDYVQGIISGNQTEEEIIITGELREAADGKYIDLQFEIAGLVDQNEYINIYAQERLSDFINYNIMPKATTQELENLLKNLASNGNQTEKEIFGEYVGTSGDIKEDKIIEEVSEMMYAAIGINITLPYEESLRAWTMKDNAEELLDLAYIDMTYSYFCEGLARVEPCYEETALENQIVELMEYDGEFEDLAIEKGTSVTAMQTQADQDGVGYGIMLKKFALQQQELQEFALINVSVSNGDSFEADFMNGYSYKVPEDGTYTFKATMKDGRKGETTIVAKSWVMAWTYNNGTWSNRIEQGGTTQGEVVVKVYETGKTITPDVSYLNEYSYETDPITLPVEGPAYRMVVEGTGDFLGDGSMPSWYKLTGESWVAPEMKDRNLVSVTM